MGLRQPSKTSVFFAQAKAGAEAQKKAREELKKPQALGGSAAAGTQMVAASTQAQKQATQTVQQTGQQAGKDLVAKPIDSQTVTTITGKPSNATTGGAGSDTITGGGTVPAAPQTAQVYTGGVFTDNTGQDLKIASGESGDVEAVEASSAAIDTAISDIQKKIQEINDRLTTTEGIDRKSLQDQKDALDAKLKIYQEKLTKENLGQIAGPSTTEQQLAEREQLLASEGQRVAKLASIFGPDWNAGRYGGLASQIYGKDLEAIQEAAAAGLSEKERAARESASALEGYSETLKTGKESYEKTLADEAKKLDILKATPQELAGYTKDELTKLFGNAADRLFTFDKDGKVIGTTTANVKKAYADRITALQSEKLKASAEKEKAKATITKSLENEYFPVDKYGNPQQSVITIAQKLVTPVDAGPLTDQYNAIKDKYRNNVAYLENQIRNAINRADKNAVADARKSLDEIINQIRTENKNVLQNAQQTVESQKPSTAERVVTGVLTGGMSEVIPAIRKLF